MSVLEARNVTRILDGEVPTTLVEDISLKVEAGEFAVIMGPSGSGKSSLLYLLGLLDPPTSGQILLDGEDVSGFDEDRLANVRLEKLGFIFQFHFLLLEFSNLENVMLPMKRLGRYSEEEIRAKAMSLLKELGLEGHEHKRPTQISGGQRQRVAIARALANDPVLILADEPTGALDTKSSAVVREMLKNLAAARNCAIVAVTHDPEFAEAAHRTIRLVDGHLVDSGNH